MLVAVPVLPERAYHVTQRKQAGVDLDALLQALALRLRSLDSLGAGQVDEMELGSLVIISVVYVEEIVVGRPESLLAFYPVFYFVNTTKIKCVPLLGQQTTIAFGISFNSQVFFAKETNHLRAEQSCIRPHDEAFRHNVFRKFLALKRTRSNNLGANIKTNHKLLVRK